MSRGGFRGGRGGGGGGRGIGPGGAYTIPAGSDTDKNQFMEALREPSKYSGQLYPPLASSSLAHLDAPGQSEDVVMDNTSQIYDVLAGGYQTLEGRKMAPWRMHTEKKSVGIEIETYSDRMKDEANSILSVDTSSAKLDPAVLYLDKAYFPPVLWAEVFEGNHDELERAKRKGAAKANIKKKRRLDSDGEDDADQPDDEQSARGSGTDEEDEFEFEDESDHQDYDANYFDNGEGDDDSGGEEEDGGGGAYED